MNLSALCAIVDEDIVGSLIKSLNLVATEDNSLDSPVGVDNVVDL